MLESQIIQQAMLFILGLVVMFTGVYGKQTGMYVASSGIGKPHKDGAS
jgi:hypothetical protein